MTYPEVASLEIGNSTRETEHERLDRAIKYWEGFDIGSPDRNELAIADIKRRLFFLSGSGNV